MPHTWSSTLARARAAASVASSHYDPSTSIPQRGSFERSCFRIQQEELFETLTSNLHFRQVGGVVASRAVLLVEEGDTLGWVQPGDTVPVLSYAGEGHYTVWFGGGKRVVRAFWSDGREFPPRDGLPGQLVVEPVVDTWTKVRNARGRIGWLLAIPGQDYVEPDY